MDETQESGAASAGLATMALELKRQVANYASWRQRKEDIAALSNRKQALADIIRRVEAVGSACRLMREESAIRLPALDPARDMANRVGVLLAKFRQDPLAITQPKALDGLGEANLKTLENLLLTAWQSYVQAGGVGGGLEQCLMHLDKLRLRAQRMADARRALTIASQHLPATKADLVAVQKHRKELREALAELGNGGLDQEIESFLKRSGNGVLLDEVIGNPKILDWLQKNAVASSFVVKFV